MSSNFEIQRICQSCGNEFTAKTTTTKCCSHSCRNKLYKKRKLNEKLEKANAETIKLKQKPIEDLKSKEFLTVKEVSQLLNCSVRSVYLYIERGDIKAVNLGQRMTRVKRSDIDNLFNHNIKEPETNIIETVDFKISESYFIKEIETKYGISEKTVYDLIKRNNVPKIKKGWYTYVPKKMIDDLLTL